MKFRLALSLILVLAAVALPVSNVGADADKLIERATAAEIATTVAQNTQKSCSFDTTGDTWVSGCTITIKGPGAKTVTAMLKGSDDTNAIWRITGYGSGTYSLSDIGTATFFTDRPVNQTYTLNAYYALLLNVNFAGNDDYLKLTVVWPNRWRDRSVNVSYLVQEQDCPFTGTVNFSETSSEAGSADSAVSCRPEHMHLFAGGRNIKVKMTLKALQPLALTYWFTGSPKFTAYLNGRYKNILPGTLASGSTLTVYLDITNGYFEVQVKERMPSAAILFALDQGETGDISFDVTTAKKVNILKAWNS